MSVEQVVTKGLANPADFGRVREDLGLGKQLIQHL